MDCRKLKKFCLMLALIYFTIFSIGSSKYNIFFNKSSISKETNKRLDYSNKLPPNKKNISIFSRKIVNKDTQNDIKKYVYLGGNPIGVKLKTKGVLVIALSDITNDKGLTYSPASDTGIRIGDYLLSIDNKKLNDSKDISDIINMTKDKKLKIEIERQGNVIYKYVKPIKSQEDNHYKLGLWVRDSTAGVGTLTFYDKDTKKFGALGHPITDIDTGVMFKINSGEIIESSIVSVRKGEKQNPGELRGIFINEDLTLGKVKSNTECGIFGYSEKNIASSIFNKPIEVAKINEIKEGSAQIITTINGEKPEIYNIEIEKVLEQKTPGPKSMVIKITDSKLLEKTGGIVQGMSGSPIIQNGKLIGAVTHVLVNKPNIGYGIYIEWMMQNLNKTM